MAVYHIGRDMWREAIGIDFVGFSIRYIRLPWRNLLEILFP